MFVECSVHTYYTNVIYSVANLLFHVRIQLVNYVLEQFTTQADLQPLHYAVVAARVEVIRYLVHTLNVPISVTAEVQQQMYCTHRVQNNRIHMCGHNGHSKWPPLIANWP